MDQTRIEEFANRWWYYGVELRADRITRGSYPMTLPLLPRMLMRKADLTGADCLDIGSMEGLIPILMKRGGANRVIATDAVPHCLEKITLLREVYRTDFNFRQVGLMYDLHSKLKDLGGFDFINLSGVLYHVLSPMQVIAGLRPLLKKNGLMIVSTNVVKRGGYSMEFNKDGLFQAETNTFWFTSIPMLDYMIRYFNMTPIDCLYYPADPPAGRPDQEVGYLSVMCRANENAQASPPDAWTAQSWAQAWEYQGLCDVAAMEAQPRSSITYDGGEANVDLLARVMDGGWSVRSTDDLRNSHHLRLDHFD